MSIVSGSPVSLRARSAKAGRTSSWRVARVLPPRNAEGGKRGRRKA